MSSVSAIIAPGALRIAGQQEPRFALRAGARIGVGARPRVLLIAEACNPDMTSVPLVGYSHCKAIKEIADALVLTHWRNGPALKNAGWVEGKDFAIIDTEWAARGAWKLGTFLRGGTGGGWTTL